MENDNSNTNTFIENCVAKAQELLNDGRIDEVIHDQSRDDD